MTRVLVSVAVLLVATAARADDIAVDLASVARADFTTRAAPIAVERAACSLGARAQIGGQDRPLEVRVEHQGKIVICTAGGPNALTLTMRLGPAPNASLHVVVEADAPRGATADTLTELKDTLRETTAEIARRAEAQKPDAPPEAQVRPTRAFSPALTVTGIVVAALGIGAVITGYGWLVSESASSFFSNRDLGPPVGLMLAGGGGILLGALFALVGEHRVPMEQTARLIPGGLRF